MKYRDYVEGVINGSENIIVPSTASSEEEHYFSAATQLIKNWRLYKADHSFQVDFEITLRDFLLLIKSTIKINDYKLSKYGVENLSLF